MLMDERSATDFIGKVVREEAARKRINLSEGAFKALVTKPDDYDKPLDIDEQELRKVVENILESTEKQRYNAQISGQNFQITGDEVSVAEIDQAKKSVKCHYLWFC